MASRAGDRTSWAILGVATAIACVVASERNESALTSEIQATLADIGPEVVQPGLARFSGSVDTLNTAVRAWAAAETAGSGAESARATAQQAFIAAMLEWHTLEVATIGPAGSPLSVTGGLGLRDAIYSWPTVNACRVDQEVAYGNVAEPADFDTRLVNVYGLDTLEYLLFVATDDNACPAQVDINTDGSWAALVEDGVSTERAAYAAVVAARVVEDTAALSTAWDEHFADQLASAGDGDSVYADLDTALTEWFAALFYLEVNTKDEKLGKPLGIIDCGSATCAETVEHPWAGMGARAVCANLVGFHTAFTGGEGTGLDDLLSAAEHGELSDRVLSMVDAANAACAAMPDPLALTVQTNPDAARAVYDAVKQITDLLKTEVAPALLLQVPDDAAGDND